MRALKFLSAHSRQVVRSRQVRGLHMTGPATFPSPLLTAERPAVRLPKDIAGLRAECARRQLPTVGSKSEVSIPSSLRCYHTDPDPPLPFGDCTQSANALV